MRRLQTIMQTAGAAATALRLGAGAVLCGVMPVISQAGEPAPAKTAAVVPIDLPATAFAESDVAIRFTCRGLSSVPWQVLVDGQTLARGNAPVVGDRAEVRFHTPQVRPHVLLPLHLAVGGTGHKITVFTRDVLADRRKWAEGLAVSLYDPVGGTAKALDAIRLPYRRLTSLGSLARVDEGMVVVGEGVELESQRGLDQTLYEIAADGVIVLLLAPAGGWLAMPDLAPERFELRGPAAGRLIEPRVCDDLHRRAGFGLASRSGRPGLQVTAEPQSYAWIDLRYDAAKGRFIAIGWGLLDRWDDSPAPRYFFVALLEMLSTGDELGGKRIDHFFPKGTGP